LIDLSASACHWQTSGRDDIKVELVGFITPYAAQRSPSTLLGTAPAVSAVKKLKLDFACDYILSLLFVDVSLNEMEFENTLRLLLVFDFELFIGERCKLSGISWRLIKV